MSYLLTYDCATDFVFLNDDYRASPAVRSYSLILLQRMRLLWLCFAVAPTIVHRT